MINAETRKRILLIGGEGFIGRNITDYLFFKYDCYSIGMERSVFAGEKGALIKADPYRERIKNDYDVVIHLIDNKIDAESFCKEEIRLIGNLQISANNHVILFSSAVVYANPDSDYGKRKIELERIYREYCDKNNIKLTIFRLFNIYGPFQLPFRQGSLIANLLYNHIIGVKTEINDMGAKRDFIYSGDVGKFIEYSIESNILGIRDLAANKLISIGDVIKKMEDVVGMEINISDKHNIESVVCPLASGELAPMIELTPMETGLKGALNFYTKNIELIKELNK